MSEMILEITDGTQVEMTLPVPFEMTLDQGRGPQGPAGPAGGGVGNLNDLTTDDKTSLVAAINELNMIDVSLVSIYNNSKAG